jgi:hypothetical protein
MKKLVNRVYSLVDRVHRIRCMVNQYQIDFRSLVKGSRVMIFCDRTGMHNIWVTAATWLLATAAPWGFDEIDGEASSSYGIRSGEVLRGNQCSGF